MAGKTNLAIIRNLVQGLPNRQLRTELESQEDPQEKPALERLLQAILSELKRSNKTPLAKIDSPWLTLPEAAAYLRFSPRYFRDIATKYEIPRHGPDKNRFNKYELDEWIDEPNRFKQTTAKLTRRKEGYKIHNLFCMMKSFN